MAANAASVADVVQEVVELSTAATALFARMERLAFLNAAKGIDWTTAQAPAYFQLDPDGNITGFSVTRADVADFLGTLSQLGKLLNNQAITEQAQHYNRLRKLSRAQVR